MARKDRSLAGFGDVASENNNVNDNENVNINAIVGADRRPAEGTGTDFLDTILEDGGAKKKDELVLTGVYLQKDVAKVLDRLGKKGGRGAKSRIANDALRNLFIEKGLL